MLQMMAELEYPTPNYVKIQLKNTMKNLDEKIRKLEAERLVYTQLLLTKQS